MLIICLCMAMVGTQAIILHAARWCALAIDLPHRLMHVVVAGQPVALAASVALLAVLEGLL